MKNLKSSRKNVGVASIASKVCAWTLSIMLMVTGMATSFAANKAATKEGRGKAQTAVSNAFSLFYRLIMPNGKSSCSRIGRRRARLCSSLNSNGRSAANIWNG